MPHCKVYKTWDFRIQDRHEGFFVASSQNMKTVPQFFLCKQAKIVSYIKLCLQESYLFFTFISQHLLG